MTEVGIKMFQPMTTAPRDGTYLDIDAMGDELLMFVYWCDEANNWARDGKALSTGVISSMRYWRLSRGSPGATDQ